jgi:hypothetical protein
LVTNTPVSLYLCVISGNPNLIAYVSIPHQGTAQDLKATLRFNFTSQNHATMASIEYCIPHGSSQFTPENQRTRFLGSKNSGEFQKTVGGKYRKGECFSEAVL